jgi:maltokinase
LRVARVENAGTLTSEPHWSAVALVTVAYDDGGRDTLNVPISVWTEAADELEHAFIGEVHGPGGEREFVYDALHDKTVTDAWLQLLLDDSSLTGIVATLGPGVTADDLPLGAASLVMTAEQSNSSVVFGDVALLKVFRRVEHGRNPDIEVHEALGASNGAHIARLLGWYAADWRDQDGTGDPGSGDPGRGDPGSGDPGNGDIAMLQAFLRSATDGWSLAQISVRDLFAEADLHADEVGGDFAAESYRLGVATAETHAALAAALPTAVYGAADLARLAEAMRQRLAEAARDVPELAPYEPGLAAVFDAVAALDGAVPVQRIHGDLHLGQVLRTTHRWVMLDFEGEPAKSIEARTAPDSPLRDVAGMLRSFDYAARHHLVTIAADTQIAYRATEWVTRNVDAFCAGYAQASGADPREQAVLLAAYEADKAVYETVYEARNRPSWLPVPLQAVERLAAG